MQDDLAWPPRKEDLERLYLVQRLSAAKIAKIYGLKYTSLKTAESTVLYHLKRNGISRREKTDHIRRPPKSLVSRWVERYNFGESLGKIAGDEFSPVTVWNYLRIEGVQLRGKIEAQIEAVTKHERRPFQGDWNDRAYLCGFTLGDCQVLRHGRAIRVRTSTTHRAMADLFSELFASYGFVNKYPTKSKLTGFEWSLQVDLDSSFDFLLVDKEIAFEEYFADATTFLSFLSGFFDAEGSVYLHRKREGSGFEISFTNTNIALLSRIGLLLRKYEFHAVLAESRQAPRRLGYEKAGKVSRITLWRRDDVARLLGLLKPRHFEKTEKVALCLAFSNATDRSARNSLIIQWMAATTRIKAARDRFVEEARDDYAKDHRAGCRRVNSAT